VKTETLLTVLVVGGVAFWWYDREVRRRQTRDWLAFRRQHDGAITGGVVGVRMKKSPAPVGSNPVWGGAGHHDNRE